MDKNNLFLLSIIVALSLISMIPFSSAETLDLASIASANTSSPYVCALYFTGAGCPHCAKAKPTIERIVNETPNLVLIKYEIQEVKENAPVFQQFASEYGVQAAIPLVLFGRDDYLQGDTPIITELQNKIASLPGNPCPTIDGTSVAFDKLSLSSLPGKPEIMLCGKNITVNNTNSSCEQPKTELTVLKMVSLAATDAINPCVYAVLVWILVAILTANPEKKKKVLLAGLAFAAAVFIIYFIYGVVIVVFFQAIQALASVKVLFYKIMAVLAILLGLLNLRDYFNYKPGRAGTEMPLMFRPKVKRLISAVTSPAGAFGVGAFVTIFLLPCTIGPYVIAGGILSSLQLVNVLPWLLFYNLIFVLPIILITLVIFGGLSSVENVSEWKDRNIKYIHLAEGIITLLLGIAMLVGWI
jgi:cytochrome c biogenesis protein CcdA